MKKFLLSVAFAAWAMPALATSPAIPPFPPAILVGSPILGTCGAGEFIFSNAGVVGCSASSASLALPQALIGATSGGVAYFSNTTTMNSSALLAANAFVLGGGAGLPPATTATGTGVVTAVANNVNTNGGLLTASTAAITANAIVTGAGSGTALTGTTPGTGVLTALGVNVGSAGAFVRNNAAESISGAFTMTSTAPQLTLGVNATTLGSIKLFGNTSGDLTISPAAAAGTASAVTFPGRSGTVAYTSGALTSGNCAKFDASGNIVDNGAVCGGGGGTPGGSSGQIQYNNAGSFAGSLLWQGTNTIEQYNSTTAQSAYIYNTRTDASNYERGAFKWATNVLTIGTEKAGTGSDRNLEIVIGGTRKADYGITNANQWTFAAVANVSGSVVVQQTSGYYTSGWGGFRFMSDGVVQLTNTAGTGFGRMQFGGTTGSFPALRRNNAVLEVRLADDSAYGSLALSSLNASGTAIDSAVSTLTGTGAGFIASTVDASTQGMSAWISYGNNSSGAAHNFFKNRVASASSAPTTAVQQDDILGGFNFFGASGTTYERAGRIRMVVDGSTISTTSMPGRIEFLTSASSSVTPTVRAIINKDGLFVLGASQANTVPALKPSSTTLQARLGDDSAYAPLSAELVTVAAGTATPAGGSTAARLLMGTTSGFGIYYGSGAPTVSAAQGSIYLRSDGSSTSTRMYVNTDGATTWTNVTTGG